MAYLIRNPLDGLRLPLDKRPRQPKSTITPEQFHALLALVPEPYASMLFVGSSINASLTGDEEALILPLLLGLNLYEC